jgi:hypothetical protein
MSKRYCELQDTSIKREYNSCIDDFEKYFDLDYPEHIAIDVEVIDVHNSKNLIVSEENYCKLITKDNVEIVIDHADVPRVKYLSWCVDNGGYPSGTISKYERIRMHNLLLDHIPVDHINRDKLDNRRRNLRKSTNSLNNKNTSTKGYSWSNSRSKWIATIKIDSKNIFIGRYASEDDARLAMFNARMYYFKEYSPDYYIIQSLKFILKTARRYAHGRQSYAVENYNEAVDLAQKIGIVLEPDYDGLITAKDGMFDKDWFEARENNSVKFITEEDKNGHLP